MRPPVASFCTRHEVPPLRWRWCTSVYLAVPSQPGDTVISISGVGLMAGNNLSRGRSAATGWMLQSQQPGEHIQSDSADPQLVRHGAAGRAPMRRPPDWAVPRWSFAEGADSHPLNGSSGGYRCRSVKISECVLLMTDGFDLARRKRPSPRQVRQRRALSISAERASSAHHVFENCCASQPVPPYGCAADPLDGKAGRVPVEMRRAGVLRRTTVGFSSVTGAAGGLGYQACGVPLEQSPFSSDPS